MMRKIVVLLIAGTVLFAAGELAAETAMERLVKRIVSTRDSDDVKLGKIERWVRRNIRYSSDKKQFNMMERWTLPYETLQRRRGDCEDGAVLLIALAASAGVPTDRLRLYAPIKTPGGWHACVAYQRESDDEWVWAEWAFVRNVRFPVIDERRTIDEMRAYAPYGTYLKVISLNPFDMKWYK